MLVEEVAIARTTAVAVAASTRQIEGFTEANLAHRGRPGEPEFVAVQDSPLGAPLLSVCRAMLCALEMWRGT
ncbi:hypothetical protein GCM10009754_33320 [Amycolatopsis minnesotensis]|uniref:Uncharacterized protein n=1 Tax=Amycolatopsis minnesotensis TaxID=337894 RepID=A0ABN2QXT6_9PSEU